MKSIEIEITGEKVQDVGYRSFLLINALNFGVEKFSAYNTEIDYREAVIARLAGEKETLKRFIDFLRSKFPKYACFMRSDIKF